jgi:hypothetical protein
MSTEEQKEGQTEEPAAPRDAASWAKQVTKLQVGEVPSEAINRNVEGRRVMSPIQGFGKMWQKTYRVPLAGADVTPAHVISEWKANFASFWPEKNLFYGPLTGIEPGEVAVLNLTMPGRLKLSTGVLVLYADEESFTFMTPQGHIFAGWITFSASEEGGVTTAQVHILMRAQDPLSEIGATLGGHKMENTFWEETLKALARHFGVKDAEVETNVTCVDTRRQWSKASNIWHSAAIRSGMYAATAPARALTRPFRRSSV